MHYLLALIQSADLSQMASTGGGDLVGPTVNLAGSVTIAGVLMYWLSRENARRDRETKENTDLHRETHTKLDTTNERYHTLKEELIRYNRVNGGGPHQTHP